MKKILSTIAIACLSFNCFAENYFVKVADNEYVLQYGERSSKGFGISSNGLYHSSYEMVYTPTHIFTYPDGNPAHFRNIQRIDYTESGVTFVKDIRNRKCCIDIYYDQKSANKCRIIGVNGREIKNENYGDFEIYEVERKSNSFIDNKQRLIYISHKGLYILSKEENDNKTISQGSFKGEILKVSAIDGNRETIGFNKDQEKIFAFNCPSNEPVAFEITSFMNAPVTFKKELTPFMKQIEKITGVLPDAPPPSEKAALNRMAEILDAPVELFVIDDGKVKLVQTLQRSGRRQIVRTNQQFQQVGHIATWENPLTVHLKGIIETVPRVYVVNDELIEKINNYKFYITPEARQRRRQIAQKPWDEE